MEMENVEKDESRITKFFRKIGDSVLQIKNLPRKTGEFKGKISDREKDLSDERIPTLLIGFFKNRAAGWAEYVFLKVQITILLLFASVTLFVLVGGPWLIFGPIMILLSFYAIVLTVIQVKGAFRKDYSAYRAFVAMCIGMAWTATFLLKYFPPFFEGGLMEPLTPVMIVLIGAVAIFAIFRAKYGREYTYGIVEEVRDDKAKVRIKYDLRSNVRQGIYFPKSFISVDEGDIVKIDVDRSLLGLRGSSVEAITEKQNEDPT